MCMTKKKLTRGWVRQTDKQTDRQRDRASPRRLQLMSCRVVNVVTRLCLRLPSPHAAFPTSALVVVCTHRSSVS